MNVFVTGGTGVIGRPAIERLRRAGHHVRALARNEPAARRLAALGAQPVPGDLFDPDGLKLAIAGSDTVLHLATKIPPVNAVGRLAAWEENDRIRRQGTGYLVDAALQAGVSTVVYPSIVLVYADAGERWIDAETAEVAPSPHVRSTIDAERAVGRFADAGGRGVSLRLGILYSPADAATLAIRSLARWGIAPVFGPPGAYWPSLWVADAASAIVAAAERAPAGVFDVVDDRPLTRGELQQAIGQAMGRRLWRLPGFVQRLLLGQSGDAMLRSQRVTNHRFVAATGWRPCVADAVDGWRRIAAHGR